MNYIDITAYIHAITREYIDLNFKVSIPEVSNCVKQTCRWIFIVGRYTPDKTLSTKVVCPVQINFIERQLFQRYYLFEYWTNLFPK